MVDLAPGDAGGDAAIGELLETTHGGTGERVVQRLAVPSPIALAGGLELCAELNPAFTCLRSRAMRWGLRRRTHPTRSTQHM